jgi:nitric oxide reductase subunit C
VLGTPPPPAASADPVALGEALFRRSPPACFSCHSLQENVILVGPSLSGLATRAATLVHSPDYKGAARTPQDYVRESIVNPHAYLVPGPTFSFGGRSIMPAFDTILKPEEIDQLVAYLVTFK